MQSQIQMKVKSKQSDVFVKAMPPGGELVYIDDFLSESSAQQLFSRLIDKSFWQTRSITMFGRKIMQPRLIAFQGDAGVSYAYSGDGYHAEPWQPDVVAVKDRIEQTAGCSFNCVLLNLYRDGRDSMGWHSDDEEELGEHPNIASLSLGEVRRFVMRRKHDKRDKLEIEPRSGSLVIMRGDTQRFWQHALPKTARNVRPRISLTFRRVACPPRQAAPGTP